VPEIKTDKDLELLNKNFNLMTDRLKLQQEKLIINERYEAWGSLARKLAHEIKNPLTPIQLTIDRIKNKYSDQILKEDQNNFNDNLKIINNQIKQIEKLVNEFSDFARMPKPIFKKHNIIDIIQTNIKLMNEIDLSIKIDFKYTSPKILLNCDKEQISRVFLNLIKNSIESIKDKAEKKANLNKKIAIELIKNNNQIFVSVRDNGVGFNNIKNNIKDIVNPYFTTKKNGTGLGLSIVSKIINDHHGIIDFKSHDDGALVEIIFKNDQ